MNYDTLEGHGGMNDFDEGLHTNWRFEVDTIDIITKVSWTYDGRIPFKWSDWGDALEKIPDTNGRGVPFLR